MGVKIDFLDAIFCSFKYRMFVLYITFIIKVRINILLQDFLNAILESKLQNNVNRIILLSEKFLSIKVNYVNVCMTTDIDRLTYISLSLVII